MESKIVPVSWLSSAEPKREHGDLGSLIGSIKEVGLLHPLTVNQDGKLLAGRRRFEAICRLGWTEVPVRILDSSGPLFDFKVALEENLKRKNLSDVEVAEALKEYQELREAEEGKKDTRFQGKDALGHAICVTEDGRSQQKTAQEFGISQQIVSRAIKIAETVEEFPELRPLQKGSVILQEASKRRRLKDAESPLPEGTFRTIYADPPWAFEDEATRAAAVTHYPTMSVEEITSLPVARLVADTAHLYLWTTNSHLHTALHVAEAWGFEYKTLITWVKPQIGLGHYFRGATEHILFCTHGGLPMTQVGERNWFEAPRQEHSEKPDLFYDLIERCSSGPYIELFARKTRPGWSAWGNEVRENV